MKTKTINLTKFIWLMAAMLILLTGVITSCEDNEINDLLEEEAMVDEDDNDDDDSGDDDDDDDDGDSSADLVTYQNTVKAILDNACVECHGASSATAGIQVHTFETAKAVAESGRMLARMTNTSSPMPPSGNLPASIVQDIMDWIDDGLLEN